MPSVTTGQAEGIGGAVEIKGASKTHAVSTVTTGAPSTTTAQGSAEAGA